MSMPAIETLKAHDQWVLWRIEMRKDKPTKVPCQPDGSYARSNDPATWRDYQTVRDAYQRNQKRYDGIGFVFSADDPYTGIDLDDCIDPQTGEVAFWAQLIIDSLASYTEISPSGCGVKIWVEGEIPHSVKLENDQVPESIKPHGIEGGIEMYSTGRYFTLTGKHLAGTPDTITAPNDTLSSLYNQAKPGKAQREREQYTKDVSEQDRLEAALKALSASRWSNYNQWIALGLALKHWNGANAQQLWESYTKGSSKYQDGDCAKWDTLNPNGGITIASVYAWADADSPGWWKPLYEQRRTERATNDDQAAAPDDASPLTGWGALIPLEDTPVTAFPDDALPRWLHDYTHGVATEVEVDPGAVALLSLAVLAAIFQRRYDVRITTGLAPWVEPLALWTLFTAEPGEKKSPVLKALTRPLVDYQQRYNQDMAALHALELDRIDKSDSEADKKLKLDPPPEPAPLALALTDTTQEALVDILDQQHERASVFSSEGNTLLAVHLGGVYRNGAADPSVLNGSWSGDAVDVARKKDRRRITLYRPAVSMGVCIQPGVLSNTSSDKIARASGFLARWLYCVPNSKMGHRSHKAPSLNPLVGEMYHTTITTMLEDAFPICYPVEEPECTALSLEPEAYTALRAFQDKIEPYFLNGSPLSVYRDWYAKAAGQAVRVAALLALADGHPRISADYMRRGIAVLEWSAAHMRRAYGVSAGADMAIARRAVGWLQRKGYSKITIRQVQRGIHISKNESKEVIDTLLEHRFIREIETKTSKRTVEYEVHPEVSPTVTQSVTLQDSSSQSGKPQHVSPTVTQSVTFDMPHQNGINGEVSPKSAHVQRTPQNGTHAAPPTHNDTDLGDTSRFTRIGMRKNEGDSLGDSSERQPPYSAAASVETQGDSLGDTNVTVGDTCAPEDDELFDPPPDAEPQVSQTIAECRTSVAEDCDSDMPDGNAETPESVASVASVAEKGDTAQPAHDLVLLDQARDAAHRAHLEQVLAETRRRWRVRGASSAQGYLRTGAADVRGGAISDWIEAEQPRQLAALRNKGEAA